ncbi:MAG: DHH family phosphoesterase [Candidatus Cloacimonadales bacterium]
MKLKWLYSESDLELSEQILVNRKRDKSEYNQRLDSLPDENLFADMKIATERILQALYSNEKIVIFGHDDPDGVTATFLLYDFFDSSGFQNHYSYIPNRLIDHHGIQDNFVTYLKELKADLVITVDNGISSKEKVEEIKALGIDVIITDHHIFEQENIPLATAVVNPKRQDCPYPYDMLAGVGVSLMLVRSLAKSLNKKVKPSYYFWTAVGSLADRVPMTGVNWVIVRHVLEAWDDISDNTINMLKSICNPILNDYDKMNFLTYCYRMIANGRDSEGQHHGLLFMLSNDKAKYDEFSLIQTEKKANELNIFGLNTIIGEILASYAGEGVIYYDEDNRIPNSLLGTCATFLVNSLYEPVIMLKQREDIIICEGRCSDGFSILDAFKYCEEALIQYGGHVRAGGFTMQKDNLERFKVLYREYFQQQKQQIDDYKLINVDAVIDVAEFNNEIWEHLDFMLPFGHGNSEPTILVKNYDNQAENSPIVIENSVKYHLDTNKNYDLILQMNNNGQTKVIDYRETDESSN